MIAPGKEDASLRLEIFSQGAPAFSVSEYSEVELRLTNQGGNLLEDCAIGLGGEVVRANLNLPPGAVWSVPFRVDDLAGELIFSVSGPNCHSQATLAVVPHKLSLDEVWYIKTERLPALLARLDAPNGLQLRYQERDEPPGLFDFFSADYSAEKLRHFSQSLLEQGVNEAILERLDYATPERRQSELYTIRGSVRWPATVQHWLNRPAETGLRHEWQHAPRDFVTLPNLLFVRFQLELARELTRLVRFVELGGPASSRLHKALPDLKERADRHGRLTESPLLPTAPVALDWDRHDAAILAEMTIEGSRAAYVNPAYAQMLVLWQDFSSRYVSLPEDENRLARSGLQPMSKIYELWAACEIAAALNLRFEPGDGAAVLSADSAVFRQADGPLRLYYNKGLRGGWYSANRPGLPRPDLRLELGDGQQLFLDVKYRVGSEERARPDDIYKMLAYMHDFQVAVGGIIFPGQQPGARAITVDSNRQQRVVELALRPPLSENQARFGPDLGALLTEKLRLAQ